MVARPLVAWLVQELMFKDRGRFRDPLSRRALYYYFRYIPCFYKIIFVSLHHVGDGRYQSPGVLEFNCFLGLFPSSI